MEQTNVSKSICIFGAGVSGLYTAKYLSKHFPVDIFERSNHILGYYRFSENLLSGVFYKILKNKNITLHLNSKLPRNCDDSKYYCYINATGGSPRKPIKNSKQAINLIEKYYLLPENQNRCINTDLHVGRAPIIIGSGDVSFDLLKYLKNSVDSVVVLVRKGINDISCSLDSIREISKIYDISYEGVREDNKIITKKASLIRNLSLHRNLITKIFSFKPKLHIVFNSNIKNVTDNIVEFESGRKIKGTDVISSLGFIPNKDLEVKTRLPIFKVGWAKQAQGNILNCIDDARNIAENVLKYIKK